MADMMKRFEELTEVQQKWMKDEFECTHDSFTTFEEWIEMLEEDWDDILFDCAEWENR